MINENVLNEARTIIASFLANRRKELGLTQIELAKSTGMGEATIKRVESGKFWINLKQYLILCQALNCYPFIAGKEKDEEWVKLIQNFPDSTLLIVASPMPVDFASSIWVKPSSLRLLAKKLAQSLRAS